MWGGGGVRVGKIEIKWIIDKKKGNIPVCVFKSSLGNEPIQLQ